MPSLFGGSPQSPGAPGAPGPAPESPSLYQLLAKHVPDFSDAAYNMYQALKDPGEVARQGYADMYDNDVHRARVNLQARQPPPAPPVVQMDTSDWK